MLGTNSKALKICSLPKLNQDGDEEEGGKVGADSSGGLNPGDNDGTGVQNINVVLE